MLFGNDDKVSERTLYKAKPNMILGCKKAIYGAILLVVVLFVSPALIQLIGKMQVHMISYVKLSVTRYATIALFAVMLVLVLYIIWQIISWYSKEYILTESKIIVKSGVLSTKKNYMPYTTIQDINTSQSFLGKIFNVGSIGVFSAYDNNVMELSNISNPSEAEDIIFNNMMSYRNFQPHPQQMFQRPRQNIPHNVSRNEYYDDFEPITPIGHERNDYQRREYEYYPEDAAYTEKSYNSYEYEPYDEGFTSHDNDIYYEPASDSYDANINDDYYGRDYYSESPDDESQKKSDEEDTSEKVIKRHFDKFKK